MSILLESLPSVRKEWEISKVKKKGKKKRKRELRDTVGSSGAGNGGMKKRKNDGRRCAVYLALVGRRIYRFASLCAYLFQ